MTQVGLKSVITQTAFFAGWFLDKNTLDSLDLDIEIKRKSYALIKEEGAISLYVWDVDTNTWLSPATLDSSGFFKLDANGNGVIANTKKVGNGVANTENWVQFGNGANIYNVPSGQQHVFRQNGVAVGGITGDGKLFVEGVGKGIILKSADGTQYEITVPNGGASLTITAI